jgi:hypothetical protein
LELINNTHEALNKIREWLLSYLILENFKPVFRPLIEINIRDFESIGYLTLMLSEELATKFCDSPFHSFFDNGRYSIYQNEPSHYDGNCPNKIRSRVHSVFYPM